MPAVMGVADDQELLAALRSLCAQEGWGCVCARSTIEALEALAGPAVQAVVLDLMLGPENGWETLRVLRAATRAPILVVTGVTVDEDLSRDARLLGAREIAAKPLGVEDLRARLRGALGG